MLKIGIDEAGRGSWIGAVFAGIVILDEIQERFLLESGINDSKKLTKKRREELYKLILKNSIYAKVKSAPVKEIDEFGIYETTKRLIKRLVEEINWLELNIDISSNKILIDGVFPRFEVYDNAGNLLNHECIIKGDEKEPSISAASILAKVDRDCYMIELGKKFPNYQLDKHKGYGTKLHSDLLKKYGICEEHRKSYKPIKSFL